MSRLFQSALLALLLLGSAAAVRAECPDPVPEDEWSLVMPLAAKSLKLAIARVGDDFVVVGDRGHILVSHDQGRSWTQQRTPTRTLLTGVHFHDEKLGWVVGHDATILRTENGGQTWCRVHFAPELEFPLFDVWFADARNGFAVGAYGYFLRSFDGGLSWHEEALEIIGGDHADDADDAADNGDWRDEEEVDDEADDDWGDDWLDDEEFGADLHMNRIVHDASGRVYILGEAGAVFRSDDQGQTWALLSTSYDGSFFGGLAPDDRSMIIFGLRGNVFRSWDAGETWRRVRVPVDTSLFGGARLDGHMILVGMAGIMLLSREGDSFRMVQRGDRQSLVSAIGTGDGAVLVIGEPGVQRLERRDLGLE